MWMQRVVAMILLLGGSLAAVKADEVRVRPNVLFIAVDDLNHWVGHLGRNPQTITPNLDRLAARGVTFTNAHCAAPVCNPSRAALLSGLRPYTSGVYDNSIPFASGVKSEQSVVTQLRRAGYETLGMGKLWHGGLGFPDQWVATGGREKGDVEGTDLDDRSIGGIRFGVLKGGDEAVPDTAIADYGIRELGREHSAPFFLTLGFHKPHMPWNVPQKYYDMHPLDQIQLPPVTDSDLADIPPAGRRMAHSSGDHEAVLKSGRWKEAVQAYLAAISYLDAQVGRVLKALDESPYRDNTIICLWGDHGWHLGEKEHWRKFALWEEATRAPMIWVVPGVTKPHSVCDRPVDFMSIYPTLCDLTHVEIPSHVQGQSIRALLGDPKAEWTGHALTTHGRGNHAIRTDRWRYIRYADGSEELYDHQTDPLEWTNLATQRQHQDLKTQLASLMPVEEAPPAANGDDEEAGKKRAKTRAANRKQKKAEQEVSKKNAKPEKSTLEPEARASQPTNTGVSSAGPVPRPNIVWIIVEDMSADFVCYGQKDIQTPHVDQLARDGVRFTRAFVTAPICSISRSALITGRYQTSIGGQNHRSSVPGHEIQLPSGVRTVPALLREAGYHVNNLTIETFLKSAEELRASSDVPVAKTDYNFEWDEATTYDKGHWSVRKDGQPFFVQIQLHGGKLRGQGNGKQWPTRVQKQLGSVTAASDVTLPPWLPDNPVIREDWAQYLDSVRWTDHEVGRIMQRLKDSGELDRTYVFFMTDHGISHVRSKQFLYDAGTHVPLIVRGPGLKSGETREDPVEHLDLAATSMRLAGMERPDWMYSRDILAPDYQPRTYTFAARDRADETVDLIRSVRDSRWKYIWNGFPNRPYLQPNNYKDNKPIVQAMRELYAAGQLNAEQSLILREMRPVEELYDTLNDPFEFRNLAADPAFADHLTRLRNTLITWQKETCDPCAPEPEDVYRTEVQKTHTEGGRNTENQQYQQNVELMLRWRTERPPLRSPAETTLAP